MVQISLHFIFLIRICLFNGTCIGQVPNFVKIRFKNEDQKAFFLWHKRRGSLIKPKEEYPDH